MQVNHLNGIRVVDLTTYAAAPGAGRMLADWGADVIKVESLSGDLIRTFGQIIGVPYSDDENPSWEIDNGNKRGVALNLKSERGREAMERLLATADIFITNVRLGSLERLGLDYETLQEKFPALVWGHISGYGAYGDEAGRPGFDVISYWARGGAMLDASADGKEPLNPPYSIGDHATSLALTAGVMAAVYKAKQTGKGDRVECSLFSTALWVNDYAIMGTQYGQEYPIPRLEKGSPLSKNYRCKDGEWVVMAALNYERFWPIICDICGLGQWKNDPRCATLVLLQQNGLIEPIVKDIERAFATKDYPEWDKLLNENDVPFERAHHMRELPTDKQALDNHYFVPVHFRNGNTCLLPHTPVQFSKNEAIEHRLGPLLGENTKEILEELGYTPEEVERMRKENDIY